MGKPMVHAQSSVRLFGGKTSDYLAIHVLIDSSRDVFSDVRHRVLTHNPWFIGIVVKIHGETITNSDGKELSVREIAEHHIIEDFGGKFMPTAQDYIEQITVQNWMDNGIGEEVPPSHKKLREWQKGLKKPYRTETITYRLPEAPKAEKPQGIKKSVPLIDIDVRSGSCGPPGVFD